MQALKLCIPIFLIIFLILGASAQKENYAQKEALKENCSQFQTQSEFSAQKNFITLKVFEAANLIEQNGEKTFPEFRENNSKWFKGDFYIFVWNTDGTRVVYPPDLKGEGQNVTNLTDANGKPIGELFLTTALSKSGEGWISYEWPKPGETKSSTKYGFIKRAVYGEKTYLVGSGFYAEDYIFTNDITQCKYIDATGISLCEFMHPERTDLDLGVNYSIAYAIIKPGEKSLPHRLSYPETYFINEGTGIIYVDNMPVPLYKGKVLVVPANETQYIENTGNTSLCLLAIDQPAWKTENEEIIGWTAQKEIVR